MTWTWAVTALAIAGVILNIQKRRICFAIWTFTNATWAAVDFSRGIYSQAALFAVYTVLAVVGWFSWRPEGRKE